MSSKTERKDEERFQDERRASALRLLLFASLGFGIYQNWKLSIFVSSSW